MAEVLSVICLIVAVLAIAACVTLLRQIKSLTREIQTLDKRLGKVQEQIARQESQVQALRSRASAPVATNEMLAPYVQLIAGAKHRGIPMTAAMLAWRLIAAYWKRKQAPRSSAKHP